MVDLLHDEQIALKIICSKSLIHSIVRILLKRHLVIVDTAGLSLLPYFGQSLTVADELNKLACNIGIGRDMAGVHWRTDISEGMKLGEAVAIGILHDYKKTYNEDFSGFSFTKFDGTTITI